MFIGKYKAEDQNLEMTSARLPPSPLTDHAIKILIVFGVVLLGASCQRFYVRALKVGAATLCLGVSFVAAAILLHCCKKPARIIHFSNPEPRAVAQTSLVFDKKKSRMDVGGYSFWIDCLPDQPCKHDVILSSRPCDDAVARGAQHIFPKSLDQSHLSNTHVTGLQMWRKKELQRGIKVTPVDAGLGQDYFAWVITEKGIDTYFPGDRSDWSDPCAFNMVKAHFPKLHRLVLPRAIPLIAIERIKVLDPKEIIIQKEVNPGDSVTVGGSEFIILPTGLPDRFSYAMKVGDQVTYIPGPHTLPEGEHIGQIKERLGPIDKIIGNRIDGLTMKVNPDRRKVDLKNLKWPKLDTFAAQAAFLMFHGFGDTIRTV